MLQTLHGTGIATNGHYYSPCGRGVPDSNGAGKQVWPATGTIDTLRVRVDTAPGAGKSWTFTIYKNGVATGLTATISGTGTTGSDLTHSVSINAGDKIYMYFVSSGGPSTVACEWTFDWHDTSNDYSLLLAAFINGWTATRYFGVSMGSPETYSNTTESVVQIPSKAGTIKNLYLWLRGASPGGRVEHFTVTLRVNGVSTTLTTTTTLTGTGLWQEVQSADTTHEVSVSEGDLVSIMATYSTEDGSTTVYPTYSMVFVPSTPGESMVHQICWPSPVSAWVAPVTRFYHFRDSQWGVTATGWGTIENQRYMVSNATTLKGVTITLTAAPGAGKSYQFTLMKNGVATAMTVTISGTNTEGESGVPVSVDDGDVLHMQCTAINTPSSAYAKWVFDMGTTAPAGGSLADSLVKGSFI